MKTKAQKGEELAHARELLAKSKGLIFADFTKVTAEDTRKLRRELLPVGAKFLVIKKRLLKIALKEKGIEANLEPYKTSIGTVFSENDLEAAAGPVYRFFKGLEVPEGQPKDTWTKHLVGGYDARTNVVVDSAQVIMIGNLPPREVLLAQLLGMLAAPIRSFLYVLDQKSKQTA